MRRDHAHRTLASVVVTALVAGGLVLAAVPSGATPGTTLNLNYAELNFDYDTHHTNITGDGKSQGDQVLFDHVATIGGTVVDALVTTTTLTNSTISNYESGASAGGAASYFQVDTDVTTAGGSALFTITFYVGGSYPGTPVPVVLQNVQVSGIDIDGNQFNSYTGISGYTWSTDTHLTAVPVPGSFPADVTFQAGAGTGSNAPQDQVVVTYGSLSTFTVTVGSANTGTAYFGVAFKALDFGVPTTSAGTDYSVVYHANGGTGTPPAHTTAKLGQAVTIAAATPLKRTGYTFTGWNTAANGSGTAYAVGSPLTMPFGGLALYAQWRSTGVVTGYATRSATVYFAPMSSWLSPHSKAVLRYLIKLVKASGTPISALAVGYVQPTPGTHNDLSLSRARAASVKAYLVSRGIRTFTSAKGLGRAYQPNWVARRATATITYRIALPR